jgi:Tat protein translocase TatB subunit
MIPIAFRAAMLNIGMPELLVILTVGLIVLGPKRMPEIARMLGKAMAEFRRATAGLTDELENARALIEEEARQASRAADPAQRAPKISPAAGTEPKTPAGAALPPTGPAPSGGSSPTTT